MKHLPLPCCYHPTTVLLVDDDELFVASVAQEMEAFTPCRTFSSPLQAKAYLDTISTQTFVDRCKAAPEIDLEDHNAHVLQQIQQEVNNPKRFEQPSVAIIDYQMPGMNGLELCAAIRQRFPQIKLVLLTAEADNALAVKAFNQQHIDQFIRKSESNLSELLKKVVLTLQWHYFSGLSQKLLDNLICHGQTILPGYFKQPEFNEFFMNLLQQHGLREFYLLDSHATFLLLDAQAKPSWLIVRNETELLQDIAFAEEHGEEHASAQTTAIIEKLRSREWITLFLTEQDHHMPVEQWGKLLHPLTQVHLGHESFYYALVQTNR